MRRALFGPGAYRKLGVTSWATCDRIFILWRMANPWMRPGEICLASFPFGDTAGMKLRPVLVVAGPVGSTPEVLVAYISSVLPTALMPSDLVLDPARPEFRSTNLKTASVLRLHKLAAFLCGDAVRACRQGAPRGFHSPIARRYRASDRAITPFASPGTCRPNAP